MLARLPVTFWIETNPGVDATGGTIGTGQEYGETSQLGARHQGVIVADAQERLSTRMVDQNQDYTYTLEE